MKIQYRSILSSSWFQFILLEIWCLIFWFSGAISEGPYFSRFICLFSIGVPLWIYQLWKDINKIYEEKTEKIKDRIKGSIGFEIEYLSDKDNILESPKESEGKIYFEDKDYYEDEQGNFFKVKRRFISEQYLWKIIKKPDWDNSFLSPKHLCATFIFSWWVGCFLFAINAPVLLILNWLLKLFGIKLF